MKKAKVDTEKMIIKRLEEAAATMKRLPPVRVNGYSNFWPEFLHTEMEKLQMELKSTLLPATPEQITRMEEACRWLRFVPNIDDRRLLWLRAERVRWKLICAKLGISRATADRRWKTGLCIIERSLNVLQTVRNTTECYGILPNTTEGQKNVRHLRQKTL